MKIKIIDNYKENEITLEETYKIGYMQGKADTEMKNHHLETEAQARGYKKGWNDAINKVISLIKYGIH